MELAPQHLHGFQLAYFNQIAIGRHSAIYQTGSGKLLAVIVIKLVAMAMTLADFLFGRVRRQLCPI